MFRHSDAIFSLEQLRESSVQLYWNKKREIGYAYNTHYSPFKSLDPSSFIFMMSERMDSWNPPESWKRITCTMMIRAGHQNKDIMTAAQCSLNTVKTIRHELETCNGDYEDVARRKIPSRRSDCVRTAEFLANLQEQVLKNPGIGIRALSREMNVAASTMKLALNEDLRYYSYKRRKGQLLLDKREETTEQSETSCGTANNLVLFR
ncbi:hypothetical protein AAG570_004157 [Ranatra chinensis]|uniref:Uncharacterized protein n=1 Tax=Ranatra chinensis TaxID=642074 RepID=A0ABD0Y2Y8_9HEMI